MAGNDRADRRRLADSDSPTGMYLGRAYSTCQYSRAFFTPSSSMGAVT